MRAPGAVVDPPRLDSRRAARRRIVLSSAVSADSLLDPAAVQRLLTGLALFRDNGARLLVTTRTPLSESDHRLESDTRPPPT